MPRNILQHMKDRELFETKLPCKIFIIIGTLDDTVPNQWPIEFAQAQQATRPNLRIRIRLAAQRIQANQVSEGRTAR